MSAHTTWSRPCESFVNSHQAIGGVYYCLTCRWSEHTHGLDRNALVRDRPASPPPPPPTSGPTRTDAERLTDACEAARLMAITANVLADDMRGVDSRLYAAAVVARDALTDALRGRS